VIAAAHRATVTGDRGDTDGNALARRSRPPHPGKTTLARAIKAGRLSASRKEDGGYEIDPSELARVYRVYLPGEEPQETVTATDLATHRATIDAEVATLRATLALMREHLDEARKDRDDARRERDEWRDQAKRLALPPPPPPMIPTPAPPTPSPEVSRLRRAWRWMRATG
jgi:hypothetical protein